MICPAKEPAAAPTPPPSASRPCHTAYAAHCVAALPRADLALPAGRRQLAGPMRGPLTALPSRCLARETDKRRRSASGTRRTASHRACASASPAKRRLSSINGWHLQAAGAGCAAGARFWDVRAPAAAAIRSSRSLVARNADIVRLERQRRSIGRVGCEARSKASAALTRRPGHDACGPDARRAEHAGEFATDA